MTKQSLKVLSICTSDSIGGAARAAYRIHQGVRQLGVDSTMLVKDKRSNDASVIDLKSFESQNPFYKAFDWVRNIFKNKLQHASWNRYPNRENIFMSDLRSCDIHGVLQKLDYDVLHLHWINQRFIPLEALPKNKPIVWTLHDSWPFCGICHYFFECKEYTRQCGNCPFLHSNKENDLSREVWERKSEIYKNLDLHIVTPSKWLAECAKQSSLFGRFPVEVIPNCLDTEVFRPLKEDEISPRWKYLHRLSKQKPLVLFGAVNATKDKIKGFAELLAALQWLENNGHSNDFELVVFGADQSDLNIETTIPIHYVGYIIDAKELVSLYNLASVVVVPSLTENLSYAIMESLSCETPVVAFNIGGNSDMIEHQQNGYLADKRIEVDLAAGICWCLKNNSYNILGKKGREKVNKLFLSNKVSEKYTIVYNNVFYE